MTKKQNDDLQLWLLLKQGDENAFALLFNKYHTTLYNYGIKLSPGKPYLIEDAIQDLFIDLWRLRGGLTKEVESVKFYLYRSLRRKIHQALRKEPFSDLPDADFGKTPFTQTSHESLLIQEETLHMQKERLGELVHRLPEKQLEALTLKYFEDFSIGEIAQIMEINEKSVRNFLYKALVTLRANRHWLVFSALMVTDLAY
jgi:RNA polymerase sigma factor (sigma-70 family)